MRIKLLLLTLCIFLNLQLLSQTAIPLNEKYKHFGNFILMMENGSISCRQTTRKEFDELTTLRKESTLKLTPVYSLNDQSSLRGLKIILRATDQLLENKEALLAFRRAAARWERIINTKITAVIDVDFGTTRWGEPWAANVLGSTNSALVTLLMNNGKNAKVTDIVNAIKSKHTDNSQLTSLYNAIPIPTPSTAGKNLDVAVAGVIPFQALGFLNADMDPDPGVSAFGNVPSIGFNSAFNYDFDPSDGIKTNSSDFDAVVTHEIGHALGYNSVIGFGGDPDNYFTPWDLFRLRPDAVEPGNLTGFSTAERIVTPGPPPSEVQATENGVNYYKANHIFFDGQQELELSTATGTRTGGDGEQASHWRDDSKRLPSLGAERYIGIMDPVQNQGTREVIHNTDIRVLEVIGYNVNYNPVFANIQLKYNDKAIDMDLSTDTISIYDVPLNSRKQVTIEMNNLSLDNSLLYEAEVITNLKLPASATANINFDNLEGTISSGSSASLTFFVDGASVPSIFYGTIRFHTNDENKLVIDIPFKVSVGGAIAPKIATSINDLGTFLFDDKSEKLASKNFSVKNLGNIELNYRMVTSLTRSNKPLPGSLPKLSSENSGNVLSNFYEPGLLKTSETIFSTDFETDFSGFTASGVKSNEWMRLSSGPALLDGHSKPTAAYFGVNYIDSIKYSDYTDAYLISNDIDLSGVPLQDMVVLSFNYYLLAEVGYDFASVLISDDGGETYNEVATSDGGILGNTSAWKSVVIQLPYLSGNQKPVKIAFHFTSDQLVEDDGWLIDDVQLTTIPNNNSVYTNPRSGSITTQNGENNVNLFVNSEALGVGYYKGDLSIISNDPENGINNLKFSIINNVILPVQNNIMYATTSLSSQGALLSINKNTGEGTPIGTPGFESLKSIAISPATHQLYGLNQTTSSYSTIVKITGGEYYSVFQYETIALTSIVFDKDNVFYGSSNDNKLYKINPDNGETTLIGNIGFKVSNMAVHPGTGELYASIDTSSSSETDKLFKLNKNTGEATLVGKTGLGKLMRGIAFDSQGNLFGISGGPFSAATFYSIDLNTAIATQVGPVNFKGVLALTSSPDSTTSVNQVDNNLPDIIMLAQNYPNPFNPTTSISYTLPGDGFVKLAIYDILGRNVKTLVNNSQSRGKYDEIWNAQNVASGVYFYQLEFISQSNIKTVLRNKMILAK